MSSLVFTYYINYVVGLLIGVRNIDLLFSETMKLIGVSFLILSLCIILGQCKPRGHPKKCTSADDCKPGYACKFIKKLGFKLCAKPKHVESRFRTGKKSRKQKNSEGPPPPLPPLEPEGEVGLPGPEGRSI